MNTKQWRHATVMALSAAGFGVGLWLLGARSAAGESVDDGVPSGTIAFFSGGNCPMGWKPAEEAQGRLIVGVVSADDVGVAVGEPLGDQEARTHKHAYSGAVMLADKVIAAADGANTNGAQAKTYDVTGDTSEAPTGLPFVQVQACAKP